MNPGLLDFQSLVFTPLSYQLPKDKDQGLRWAQPAKGVPVAMATSDLPSCYFPGVSTEVKDAALGVLHHDPHPQQRLPRLPILPTPQVSSSEESDRSQIPTTPAGGEVA